MSFRADRIYLEFLRLTRRLSNQQIMMLLAVVVGVLAGLGTYLFEMLLHGIKSGLIRWFPVDSAHILFLIYPAVGIILATLFVKYIVRDNISEGVTRVLYAMSRRNSRIARHNCWTSIVGGATTIGFGGSVGPEAPIVLTGAAIGSNIGRLARLNYKHTTLLLCCGAGAALAAIFKAPITGVVFVLEILMLDITAGSVIPLLIASITATTMAFMLRGFDPILAVTLAPADAFELWQIPLFILLGVLCGLMAWYFTSMNSRVGGFFKSIDKQYKKWLWGGAILGILIFVFPPLYGEGYEGFTSLMHGNAQELFNNSLFYRFRDIDWVIILFVIATMFFKVIAMSTTNAAGGVGGTFAPSLFVGAFTGASLALVCNTLFGWEVSIVSFTLVGMAGVMSGVMNAPLTSIFLIAELSNGYGLFIPLMITACISFAVDYYLDPDSIYQAAAPEGRTADPRQGPVGVRLPETRRADGDRFPAHQGEHDPGRHRAHHFYGPPQHLPRDRQLRPADRRGAAGRPARGHVQTREIRTPDLGLHDSAAGQDHRTRGDFERHGEIRGQARLDAARRGQAGPLPGIHLQVAHSERIPRTTRKNTAMTTENALPWAEEADCAVTVCDTEGVILYMNEKARATFAQHGDLIGRNLFDCHNERSRETIRRMLASGGTNAYTIEKQGVRKMIYQTAWRERGEIRGLVEISMELPDEMPHYIRK